MVKKLVRDFRGLGRVCGWGVAFKWLWKILLSAKTCLRTRNLNAADFAMGQGPFVMRRGDVPVKMYGHHVISGIREIWARDIYLTGGWLTLPQRGTVVDLGANRGYFTALAASGGQDVRVVCVEPSRVACEAIKQLCALNGWNQRVQILNYFIGGDTPVQHDLVNIPGSENVPFVSEDELIRQAGIERIALLKCDIEGSEFGLLQPSSRLLALADQITMEVHDALGDRKALIATLTNAGFECAIPQSEPHVCIVHARRRRAA